MPTSARYDKSNKASRVNKLFQAGNVGNLMEFQDVRSNRLQEFRQGTHTQMWRVDEIIGARQQIIGHGANLGAMGELGDDTILYVVDTDIFKELIDQKFIKKKWVYRKLYSIVYKPLKTQLLSLINAWVPSDEGDLRRAIAKSITQRGGSQIHGFPFLVMLNSRGVEYGKVVDKMPTSWLKHGGSGDVHHLLGRRTRSRHPPHNPLRDPKAIQGFYGFILLSGRKKAKKLYKKFRRIIFLKLKEELEDLYSGREISNIAGSMLIPHYDNMYK
ncbi:MAG: hypothetical protein ACTSPK_00125 [Candidatus Heimdallarchaeota archaeon]